MWHSMLFSGCYGLEKCLGEFDLVDIQPGSKLWNLGLRRVDLSSSELSRQRDELEQMRASLSQQMKQRQLALIRQEELRIQARGNILCKNTLSRQCI